MFFAQRGVPPLWLVVATVVGGTLSAGSANALNCVYDRDIDEQMRRTRRRALPRHIVTPRAAFVFGLALMVVSTLVLGFYVNWLSSGLALAASAFYLFGYTMVLKRRTTQNIVWGGLAGCFPTLIGWTAVTNELAWPPVVLFLVVFFWTPPHTWALAMRYREDYARVDVPMLPVVKDAEGGLAPDRGLLVGDGRDLARAVAGGRTRGILYPIVAARPRRRLPRRGPPDVAARPPQQRARRRTPDAAVPLVQHVSLAAVRRRRAGPAATSAELGVDRRPVGPAYVVDEAGRHRQPDQQHAGARARAPARRRPTSPRSPPARAATWRTRGRPGRAPRRAPAGRRSRPPTSRSRPVRGSTCAWCSTTSTSTARQAPDRGDRWRRRSSGRSRRRTPSRACSESTIGRLK